MAENEGPASDTHSLAPLSTACLTVGEQLEITDTRSVSTPDQTNSVRHMD